MKLTIDKGRFALVLVSLGGAILLIGLLYLYLTKSQEVTTLQVKLHALPERPVALQTVTPTATPTAALKFYPTKGLMK